MPNLPWYIPIHTSNHIAYLILTFVIFLTASTKDCSISICTQIVACNIYQPKILTKYHRFIHTFGNTYHRKRQIKQKIFLVKVYSQKKLPIQKQHKKIPVSLNRKYFWLRYIANVSCPYRNSIEKYRRGENLFVKVSKYRKTTTNKSCAMALQEKRYWNIKKKS